MTTELVTLPANLTLPAHLQTPEAAAAIAAANAAAAGGIKAGGFPSVSIKANKFHEKENGELKTYMQPAVGGQPPLPLMCLDVVVVAANSALNKTYFEGDYVEGEVKEPLCRSSNGIAPDTDIATPQHAVCATCKQNAWGSKVSKISQKDIKACDDAKQLAVLPAADLGYKALGLLVHKGSLKNWGQYVNALSGRGYPITGLVTSITFDATQNGVLNFAFNRFLTAEEDAKVKERATGTDVKTIVAQSRTIAPAVALPASTAALPGVVVATAQTPVANVEVGAGVASVATATGFGATAAAPAATAPATTEAAAPRTRRTRAQIAADETAANTTKATAGVDPTLAHLPADVLQAVTALGKDSPGGKAMLAAYPAPKPELAVVDPYAGQGPHVKVAVEACGGLQSEAGAKTYQQLTGKLASGAAAPQGTATIVPGAAGTAAVAAPGGFGGTMTAAPSAASTPPSAQVVTAASDLKAKLMKTLGKTA